MAWSLVLFSYCFLVVVCLTRASHRWCLFLFSWHLHLFYLRVPGQDYRKIFVLFFISSSVAIVSFLTIVLCCWSSQVVCGFLFVIEFVLVNLSLYSRLVYGSSFVTHVVLTLTDQWTFSPSFRSFVYSCAGSIAFNFFYGGRSNLSSLSCKVFKSECSATLTLFYFSNSVFLNFLHAL